MTPAKIPVNEAERLAELRDLDVLDTDPEQRYDDLTRLASEICQTPMAFVSLVDEDRQWFKSRHGLDVEQTPREVAFCAHAILEDELFLVPDALADERFADNPLVTEMPGIRAYAGVPLHTSGGCVGSLCAVDTKPHELSDSQLESLKALGRQVVAQLELHRENRRLRDIQEDLKKSREEAEAANTMKGQFLANMSHEIRTPLNGVIGMIDLALDTELNREQRDFLVMAERSAETLMAVINDILDFSKIESGNLTLDPHRFELREVVECMISGLALRAYQKSVELACRIDPSLPVWLCCDSLRLRQILVNLIGNAIKFTEHGEVVVTISGSPTDDANKISLECEVRDTGIGIAVEQLDSIFEAFTQADGSTSRKYGGTGLGLPISSQLVELMGGTLQIESTPGKGSRFWFRIDVAIAEDQDPFMRDELQLIRGQRILVVDDNETNRMILEDTLIFAGAAPTMASSGSRALLQLGRAAAAGTPFQLLITDLNMPHIDGLELIRELRAMDAFKELPIIVLSSGGDLADVVRRQGEQLDISSWLMKPARQSALFEAIAGALSMSKTEPERRQLYQGPSVPLHGRRLLLAEDNPVNQMVVVTMLEKCGCQVDFAVNGELAVEAYKAGTYDAIVMDMRMPVMDGLEATRAIRKLEAGSDRHIPIIAATANAMEGDRESCLASGVDGYVTKPLTVAALLEELRPHLEFKPIFDPSKTSAGDYMDLLLRIIDAYLDQSEEMMDRLRITADSGSAPALRDVVHSIKGMVSNFGASGAITAAEELEQLADAGISEGLAEAVSKLEGELTRLTNTLEAQVGR